MSRHDDQVSLRQMLAHAGEACGLIRGKQRLDLNSERVLALALVQLLPIVGEAATRVSPAVRDGNPGIPWEQIVALRNRLVHGYDSINLDIVWSILTNDLRALIVELEKLVQTTEQR